MMEMVGMVDVVDWGSGAFGFEVSRFEGGVTWEMEMKVEMAV